MFPSHEGKKETIIIILLILDKPCKRQRELYKPISGYTVLFYKHITQNNAFTLVFHSAKIWVWYGFTNF